MFPWSLPPAHCPNPPDQQRKQQWLPEEHHLLWSTHWSEERLCTAPSSLYLIRPCCLHQLSDTDILYRLLLPYWSHLRHWIQVPTLHTIIL